MSNLALKNYSDTNIKSEIYKSPYLLGLFVLEPDLEKISAELSCPINTLKRQHLDLIQKKLSDEIGSRLKKFSEKISTDFSMVQENCNGTCW